MQTLTDAHKAWIRKTVHGGAENLIADLERDAGQGADIEQFMTTMYFVFGMSAPLPAQSAQPDEPTESDDSEKD